jgi:hypothetical protein
MKKEKFTGKLTTDGIKIFEGDIVEAKTTKSKYPLFIGGQVKWDKENKKWLNLNFFDNDVPHTLFLKNVIPNVMKILNK